MKNKTLNEIEKDRKSKENRIRNKRKYYPKVIE